MSSPASPEELAAYEVRFAGRFCVPERGGPPRWSCCWHVRCNVEQQARKAETRKVESTMQTFGTTLGELIAVLFDSAEELYGNSKSAAWATQVMLDHLLADCDHAEQPDEMSIAA